MGIIIKESLYQTIIRIGLSLLGALATIFVYPLDREIYGIFGFLIDTSILFMPLVVVGLGHTAVRFYPYFNESFKQRRKFLLLLSLILIINIILTSVLYYAFNGALLNFVKNTSSEFSKFLFLALIGTILFGCISFLYQYLSNFKKLVIPTIWMNLYKIVSPIIFVLVILDYIQIDLALHMILGSFLVSLVALLVLVVLKINRTNTSAYEDSEKSISPLKFMNYYLWAFASSLGALVAFRIDGFMISVLSSFESNGDYRLAMTMAMMIAIPIQSVLTIASPIVSSSWKRNDLKDLIDVYLKGSKNLLFVGCVLLLGLIIFVLVLPYIIPAWQKMTAIKYLVAIIGLAKLFDMMSGVNGTIIQHSPWYRFNTYFILFLSITNIILNYFLILKYDLIGAAIATAISLTLFNIAKCAFLYTKIKVHPYSRSSLMMFVSVVLMSFAFFWLEENLNIWVYFSLSSLMVFGFILVNLFYFDLAPESRNLLIRMVARAKLLIK